MKHAIRTARASTGGSHFTSKNTPRKRAFAGLLLIMLCPAASWANPATINHPGRLLASNCFQCHGTDGKSVGGIERLAGESAREIAGELREMRNRDPGRDIMNVHAQAYTDAEISLIADYFSKQ